MIGPRNSLPINTEVIEYKHVLPGVKCKQSNQRLRDGPVRHQFVGTFHV